MSKRRAFVAYRHTGESADVLRELLTMVRDSLNEAGVDSYCTFFAESDFKAKKLAAREIMRHAFEQIDKSDFLLVIQASEAKSEGMIMEVGYCVAKQKPIVIATKSDVENTYLPAMTDLSFTYNDLDDLSERIKSIELTALNNR